MPMTKLDTETCIRFWQFFNQRDWENWLSLLAEDVEWHAREDEPDADVYRGRDMVLVLRDLWLEMFPDLSAG